MGKQFIKCHFASIRLAVQDDYLKLSQFNWAAAAVVFLPDSAGASS